MRTLCACLVSLSCAGSLTAADFLVTTTSDSGPGSLYQAITDANSIPGADRILFNIPGSGVHTINVSARNQLPTIVDSLEIDGYSQPGAKPNSVDRGDDAVILIQLDGGAGGFASANNGLVFYRGSGVTNYSVRGLSVTGFGTAITAAVVDSLVVAGNFIGVLPDGETARANGIGIGHATQIGGTDLASRNIISGNGVGFAGEAAPAPGTTIYGAVVEGNYFGTNASGTKAIPNTLAIGLEYQSDPSGGGSCTDVETDLSNTIIGGAAPGAGNLISGNGAAIRMGALGCNGFRGLPVSYKRANGVRIQGNAIGLQADRANALPNGTGITIAAGSDNLIGDPHYFQRGNVIAFNGSGVIIDAPGSLRNEISGNSIYKNQRIGIDLGGDGPTPNDVGDSDTGPNNLQNYPLIDSVTPSNSGDGSVVLTGTLNSTPNSTFELQFFGDDAAGSSGFGEGQSNRGGTVVTTDANGDASFTVTLSDSALFAAFSATAIDSAGNTSEFSPAFPRAAQLVNLSTRAAVGTGDNVLIGGFIISGTQPKKVLLRGLGPSLSDSGVAGALADPTLQLHDSSGAMIINNDNWKDTQSNEISATGLAPSNDLESAIVSSLAAAPASEGGAGYTGILAGKDGLTGIGLLEIYDLATDVDAKLANISTRGFVGAGDAALIAGFIPDGAGRSPARVLIRGLGPSLAAKGVSGALSDPLLELHDANGTLLTNNDNWRDADNASEIAATGIAPSDDREAAILAPPFEATPNGYTAVLRGANGAAGIALVEIYALN